MREGFRDLAEGVEYDHAFSNIVIEDSTLLNSRGVGIFVDGYVTGVTHPPPAHRGRRAARASTWSTGRRTTSSTTTTIVNNGFNENGPFWQLFESERPRLLVLGHRPRGPVRSTARASTPSRNNRFSGNAAGAIFLYKNCGEFVNLRPERWFAPPLRRRRQPDREQYLHRRDNGVWIAARMGENIAADGLQRPAVRARLRARLRRQQHVRDNVFQNVTFGVRVEDDGNTIDGQPVLRRRRPAGDRPRHAEPHRGAQSAGDRTTITGNAATIAGQPESLPLGARADEHDLHQQREPGPRRSASAKACRRRAGPFVMTVAFVGQAEAPTDPPAPIPTPGPLPPCALACTSTTAATRAAIRITRLDTPPGDDTLAFNGRVALAHPFSPARRSDRSSASASLLDRRASAAARSTSRSPAAPTIR